MSLTSRVLPVNEWGKLEGMGIGKDRRYLPEDADVVVVERDGVVVGCCSLFGLRHIHLEGMEITPEERGNPSVGRQLLCAIRARIDELRVPSVFAGSKAGAMAEMLARLDAKPLDMTFYVLPVGGKVL